MMRHSLLSLLAAGCAAFATGCSSPQGSSAVAAPESAAKPVVAERGPGTRADSLNGIPGHPFGTPLSAFAGLKLVPAPQQQPGYITYRYPNGKGEPGWFGKRIREAGGVYYSFYRFKDGRFASFMFGAYNDGRPALDEQANYLFGPGVANTGGGLSWEGQRVFAFTTTTNSMGSMLEMLEVKSQEFVKAQAKEKADKLKAENAL